MEILSTIVISLLSGAIVFFFGQKAIKAKERDDEKKKLNKLLFHLLIIRRMATDRLNFNDSVSLYFEELIKQIQIKFKLSDDEINSPEAKEMIDMSKSVLKKNIFNDVITEYKSSSDSIAILIEELTETNPLFALTLKGFDIEKKKNKINNYLSEIKVDDDFEIMTKQLISNLEQEFLIDLDEIIHDTTEKLDRKTQREVQELLIHYDKIEINHNSINDFVNNFFKNSNILHLP